MIDWLISKESEVGPLVQHEESRITQHLALGVYGKTMREPKSDELGLMSEVEKQPSFEHPVTTVNQ